MFRLIRPVLIPSMNNLPRGNFSGKNAILFNDLFKALDREQKWQTLAKVPRIDVVTYRYFNEHISEHIDKHLLDKYKGSDYFTGLHHMNVIAKNNWYTKDGWQQYIKVDKSSEIFRPKF